ncbi:hypothetical protein CR152_05350 [Massilia violaceinigra]|uniref:Uncharacterized protein n=1 Tax=Massilia violaceinigra TaxID=2045208 RepID=A0A2D2DG81_9BURK|nr:hypothetical protein [Massilia violaceinigra]ATQ74008.1 hypothetical protein CR152_05350 [Massilia violaceinigra]
MGLGSHFNVYNTCLLILRDRGFKMHVQGEMDGEGCYPTDALWIAEKDGFRFMGDNPIELLGLVAIYDEVQPAADLPYWWRKEGEDIWRQIMREAFPDRDAGPS